ncbi:hypothetical protein [Marinigracilibium pacificum]|uniref:Uncharacterized protein n=1 Tax=Marinigracilibium pacificum TaxID=2729599 RepID=A0A848IXK4_9BACT|nr:hypothetical protein [Marinigracilibium pacificum]NMM47898.1 hypothetical protein [Marinigracilibium pacificum]
MKKSFIQLMILCGLSLMIASCDDDDDDMVNTEAGTLNGGPFNFVIDGNPDMVSGITQSGDMRGSNSSFVITDDAGNILGLPPNMTALEGVNFDGAGPGICLIWYIRYEDGLMGLEEGENADDLTGNYDLSNSITVDRQGINGGAISGGPFTFIVDGEADMVSGITLDDTNVNGPNSTWVITDDENNILGIPPTLADVEGVNFDGAGGGICLIWHMSYGTDLMGAEVGNNVSDLTGAYGLSNSIMVTRGTAGMLSGGPFNFDIDGTPDMVSGITVTDNFDLANTSYVITDDAGNILGLPGTMTDLEGVDFDPAGAGVCLIWRITYADDLTGLEVGENAANLSGTYSLSNSITVNRN